MDEYPTTPSAASAPIAGALRRLSPANGHAAVRRHRADERTAATTSSFKLHLRRLPANEVQLLADPIGSARGVTSELLRVSPGDEVRWILESDLARSHVEIR